jgi:hypothetical protein
MPSEISDRNRSVACIFGEVFGKARKLARVSSHLGYVHALFARVSAAIEHDPVIAGLGRTTVVVDIGANRGAVCASSMTL